VEIKMLSFGIISTLPNTQVKLNKDYGRTIFLGNTIGKKADTFQNKSPLQLCDISAIKNLIASNPKIYQILAENKMPLRLNMEELQELFSGHCKDTQDVAVNIVKYLPQALKQNVDIKTLKEGALLHDFGKVLIPSEILNKNTKLTEDEYKIMNLHSELGYELLKNSGIDEEVLTLVKYHHNNIDGSFGNKTFIPDINLQVLNLADKYSALTEKRVYKQEFSPQKALTILYGDVKKGNIHPFLFNALVKSVQTPVETKVAVNY
jgi:putative nucleotidyltransferase with HDIG domain